MATPAKMNASAPQANPIVLFGIVDGKPRAGLFAERDSKLVMKAAKQLELTALKISTPALTSLTAKIAPGRLYANRKSFVPLARRDVHDKLVQAAASSEAAGTKGHPKPTGFPKDWRNINAGHQVLAQASVSEGWWEAIVVNRKDDMLTVVWRDYPEEKPFQVHRRSVAIQLSAYDDREQATS